MLTAKCILVKINSVMIPGVNDAHRAEMNLAMRSPAFLYNIMPLISDPAQSAITASVACAARRSKGCRSYRSCRIAARAA